jgi:uncharacterized protein
MLHRYAFANFQSFAEHTEVDLTLNRKVQRLGWEAPSSAGDQRLSTVLAVVGPNAAGKTALLKPIPFLAWFTSASFHAQPDAPIPVQPHFDGFDEPTEFEVEAEDAKGRLWRYALKLTRQRVLHEALYQKKERFSYVFVRDWDDKSGEYTVKQQDFGFAPSEARKVRPNASLISTAAQYGVELARTLAASRVATNIDDGGRRHFRAEQDLPRAARHFKDNETHRAEMVRLLRAWDFGLHDVVLREERSSPRPGEDSKTWWMPYGLHLNRDGERCELSFSAESSGTQGAFMLLSLLLPVLSDGGLAVIDEFESDLHPHMLEPILELFANPQTNPHRAQLLFTCHAVEVLNVLHKSQVMLVEKNDQSESRAWRMDSVQGIRNDDNFYAKYMTGAYGAVPNL